jgi:Flp pilus assembly pilin Flp
MPLDLLGVPAMKTLLHFMKKEDGTTMPEYALISLVIALAAIFFTIALGLKFMHLFMHG